MSMSPWKLHRRAVLRGMGGAAVVLPVLEVMANRRAMAAAPRRFALLYGGTSLAGDGSSLANAVVPTAAGPDWELTRGLQPIGTLGVKPLVTVVSALKIPWAQAGGAVPAAGRPVNFHGSTLVPQATGRAIPKADSNASGPSADQIVADAIGAGTAQRSIAFRVQPVSYSGGTGGSRGRLSSGKGGATIDPIVSPRLAFQSLFAGLAAPGAGTAPDPERALALYRRRSVLDLVRGDTERLTQRLGRADKVRLQRHLDELRDLELRIDIGGGKAATATCGKPMDPGVDPPIGSNHVVENNSLKFTAGAGYSSEDLRAQLITDMVAMAFACDLSRAASIMFTMTQCFMSMEAIGGQKSDMHQLGHGAGNLRDVADAVAFHVKHFARLVAKLRDTADLDGRSVLDSSALVLVFEGGHGYDPEGNRMISSHSSERMIALVAGRAGGLKPGQHLVATDKHPAQVVLAAMNGVGVPGPFGEITTPLAGLS